MTMTRKKALILVRVFFFLFSCFRRLEEFDDAFLGLMDRKLRTRVRVTFTIQPTAKFVYDTFFFNFFL